MCALRPRRGPGRGPRGRRWSVCAGRVPWAPCLRGGGRGFGTRCAWEAVSAGLGETVSEARGERGRLLSAPPRALTRAELTLDVALTRSWEGARSPSLCVLPTEEKDTLGVLAKVSAGGSFQQLRGRRLGEGRRPRFSRLMGLWAGSQEPARGPAGECGSLAWLPDVRRGR